MVDGKPVKEKKHHIWTLKDYDVLPDMRPFSEKYRAWEKAKKEALQRDLSQEPDGTPPGDAAGTLLGKVASQQEPGKGQKPA